jgi:hypothetical protein
LFFEGEASGVLPTSAKADLDTVFASRTFGFRELLATVVFAKLIDKDYDPTASPEEPNDPHRGLYSCNPRPLYEAFVRPLLQDRGVPCRQSGPLNIAKATERLNQQWAAQRRPRGDAQAMLRLVELLMGMTDEQLRAFARELGDRFDELALEVVLTQANLAPVDSAAQLSRVSRELIDRYPLGGAIPQLIVGVALEAEYFPVSGANVEGARDSPSTTNLTSGKAGDITVELDGDLVRVYEVTVKPFSAQRIGECLQSIHGFFGGDPAADMVVIVLCRPEDVPEGTAPTAGSLHLGELIQGGVVFDFVNIYEWLACKLVELPLSGRRYFFEEVQNYLNGPNIPTEIREYWTGAFGE